jgi:PKD repeat protein
MNKQSVSIYAIGALGLSILSWAPPATAFEGFDGGGACAGCHATLANFGPAHATHAALANNACGTCHADGRQDNPPLAACVQCHGREEDAGGDNISAGIGRGLRQHHDTAGVTDCRSCHGDVAGPVGVGENVAPAYYKSASNTAGLDTCDGSEEKFDSRSVSLDNDGDGLTDGADPDCAANQPPTADPGGPYNASVGSPVSFDGTGSSDPDGSIAAYDWDFGDGNTGTGATPVHTYTTDGTFTVSLTVTDDAGALDTQATTATIAANPLPPIADANGPYSGVVGSPVGFDGTSSSDPDGSITAYAWDFGDGGLGTGATPTHIYSVDGTYTVVLTVTDNDGQTSVDTTSATINPAGGNVPPVANANGPYSGTEGVAVQFSSSGSMDTDGVLVAYDWGFGDGGGSTAENPAHAYIAAGTYTVTLTVTDDAGDSGSDSTTVTIEAPAVNSPPSANANGPYSGFVGDAIVFDGSGSVDPDGIIVRYDWEFGDGTTLGDAGPAPSHTYAAAGDYTVILTVTDDMGATDSAPADVAIGEPLPLSDGEAQYNSYCVGCHGDPWSGPAADPGLPGFRRVTGARACVIEGAIFGTYVFPDGAPGMQFLQQHLSDGTVDVTRLAEYLNSRSLTGEQFYVTACAGCHGTDGSGGRTGEEVHGEDAYEIWEAIRDESAMRYLACLPDSDIEAISAFLGAHDGDDDDDSDSDHDYDGDGLNDDEDEDDDNDGVSDEDERDHGTDPRDEDTDDDGLDDGDEHNRGTDPNDADTDNDGVTDGDEVMIFGTDPLVADTTASDPPAASSGGGAGGVPLLLLVGMFVLLRLKKRRQRQPGTPQ